MSKKFIIGDRTKDEWISVLDTEKKKLEFTNHIATAKEFHGFEETKAQLKKLQETGYFTDWVGYSTLSMRIVASMLYLQQ